MGIGIGTISDNNRATFAKTTEPFVKEVYEESTEEAIHEEIGWSVVEDQEGINVLTDARHGWRKNAKDSSIVVIGEKSHKVLRHEHVTKQDELSTQKHELLGTKRALEYFDEKQVLVQGVAHDRNTSVNKLVKDRGEKNQNDRWHGVKSFKKKLKPVTEGANYKHGQTWHRELSDKLEPVCTHFHWAMQHCSGDADILRERLLNTVNHYKNIHDGCPLSSRCMKDPNYEPSRIVITDPKAELLLRNVITESTIYKYAEDFTEAKETYWVESFNNTMNIFHDKRISMKDLQYQIRSYLAVAHWNENTNREVTSIKDRSTRRKSVRKRLKAATYSYRKSIWDKYMHSMFNPPHRANRRNNTQ